MSLRQVPASLRQAMAPAQGWLRRGRLPVTVAALAVIAVSSGAATWSAFSGTTANTGNDFVAGTVQLIDNGSGSSPLDASDMKPGDSVTTCITVSYNGSLPASVRLFGATTGTLRSDLLLMVTRGSGTVATDCTGFVPDSGPSLFPSAPIGTYPATYATPGIDDPDTSWTSGEARVYRVVVTLDPAAPNSQQGATAESRFTWEARST